MPQPQLMSLDEKLWFGVKSVEFKKQGKFMEFFGSGIWI